MEDASSELIQILRKIEGQHFLARFIFKSTVTIATSKLGGKGEGINWSQSYRPRPQLLEEKAKSTLLTSVVRVASRNWKLTFLSDSLMAESCLLSSARVKLLPWALRVPPVSALEAVSAHSC
jgi:hypothetical protein